MHTGGTNVVDDVVVRNSSRMVISHASGVVERSVDVGAFATSDSGDSGDETSRLKVSGWLRVGEWRGWKGTGWAYVAEATEASAFAASRVVFR